ncbi:MAG TPA: phosphoenolpyruvate carboxykinase (GTP) [Syntrophobacteraceae bacterium]|nr:phosphoenolpyruvate carboxykinase (GTP) [Syntrophobacteraceae bacterium]
MVDLTRNRYFDLLQGKMSAESFHKLAVLNNEKLFNFVGEYVELCEPESVYMCDDSDEDAEYLRKRSLELGEEKKLGKEGHTVHFDGYHDQGRAPGATKNLVRRELLAPMKALAAKDRDEGMAEIREILRGIMKGKEAVVKLSCEGPTLSPFSIGCAQISDSFYVCHSEEILYRRGYEHFMGMEDKDRFFRFIHSAGELDDRGNSVNLDKRRIYQDLEDMLVLSANNQYAGNSVGLKKHAMRLAIRLSGQEGWLCEHMFIMAVQNPPDGRSTYFCGAFPSACGKTSTAMLPGEKIVGDDIAYFRNIGGEFRAVNVERGIFGIIKDVNPEDDPIIFKTLQTPGNEIIYSNVLVGPDNAPYWLGMGTEVPEKGTNFSGDWYRGKKDELGNEIPFAHSNARYTLRLMDLENIDHNYKAKNGVWVRGIIYGGRDSDTSVPIEESPDWESGIILKACTLESETTSATIGKEGVLAPQPMANLDFISYPIGQYVLNNIHFVRGMENVPRIYTVNYFLKNSRGQFLTSKMAKKVWIHWAERRVHGEFGAHRTPLGWIPIYEDLAGMFREFLEEDFSRELYDELFKFRIDPWIAKLNRAIAFFEKSAPDCPEKVYSIWKAAIAKLQGAKSRYGACIPPGTYRES